MEPRAAQAKINPDGTVLIRSSSQAPHAVRKEIADVFGLELGKVIVETPLVGGGFGGKASVQLERSLLASRAVGGPGGRIANSREEDIDHHPAGWDWRQPSGSAPPGTEY
jgi:CO/xanthine dehydrogenase Mo-binding subunit